MLYPTLVQWHAETHIGPGPVPDITADRVYQFIDWLDCPEMKNALLGAADYMVGYYGIRLNDASMIKAARLRQNLNYAIQNHRTYVLLTIFQEAISIASPSEAFRVFLCKMTSARSRFNRLGHAYADDELLEVTNKFLKHFFGELARRGILLITWPCC